MTAPEFLAQLVRTPSLSREEGAAADLVADTLSVHGANVKREGNNVWAEIGTAGPRLVLNSHLDTVPAGEGWSVDPYAAEWIEGRLTGLGANDAKGCATSMLYAFRAFLEQPPEQGRLLLVLSAEEEIGSVHGLRQLMPQLGPIDAALIGEPTRLRPCLSERGRLMLRGRSPGRAAHAAHPHLADNAIERAFRDMHRVLDMTLPGATTLAVTSVRGGGPTNQIPAQCEWTLDIRSTPEADHAALLSELRALVESELTPESDIAPRSTPIHSAIARAALASSPEPEPYASTTLSDWASLAPGTPAVKIGPGDTARSHTHDEYLLLEELEAGIDFYVRCCAAYWRYALS